MKKILLTLLFLLGLQSMVCASPSDLATNASNQSKISVVVFLDRFILNDRKAVVQIRDVFNEKFKSMNSVDIYGDDKAKSPEFLEFIEKIKTDPANEEDINTINIGELAKYGRSVKSDYVILIRILPCNAFMNYWSGLRIDMKESVSVIDVNSVNYVEYLNWYKEATGGTSGAKYLANKLATDFHWSPSIEKLDVKKAVQANEKKPSVVVFLPDIILEKPDLVEQIRTTVSKKFQVSEVSIYVDDKPKSLEFLNLVGRVETDSAKQQTFILKKEQLVKYGKETNSTPVTAIVISKAGPGDDFSYRLKEDILVVDAEKNIYLSNAVYDTGERMKRQEGIDLLMSKLQNEFKLP